MGIRLNDMEVDSAASGVDSRLLNRGCTGANQRQNINVQENVASELGSCSSWPFNKWLIMRWKSVRVSHIFSMGLVARISGLSHC